jgi:catechol 2,3-dioxygenase-like lactoylglutathione lyase family enzyme
VTANAERLADFYEKAFGCHRIATEPLGGPASGPLMNRDDGARCLCLALGDEIVELWEFAKPGDPYPAHSLASDLIFQHFAILVTNMAQALQRLSKAQGWVAITRGGPQHLPAQSGGVTAFKFRDPEGHPLEFLQYPALKVPQKWQRARANRICLGIDHSAISIGDMAVSIDFYEALGLRRSGQSLNVGREQECLDALPDVKVEVTTMLPPDSGPHLELLCYQRVLRERPEIRDRQAIAATRLVFELQLATDSAESSDLLDPDAHHLTVVRCPEIRRLE